MAKKVIRDERLKLDMVIDGNKGQMELGKLEDEARKLNQQVKELGAEMGKTKDKDSEAYKTMQANRKDLNTQLDLNKQKQAFIRKELGLNGLTYKQLGQEAKRLQLLLSNSTYGSEQWKKLDAELRRVKTRMSEVRGGSVNTNSIISKMATGFNKYFTMISTFALSLTGIIAGIRKAYLAYAEFDDKMADVMKTTGLTKDQVKELNKEFDKIDTRSSQEELLDLARIAGKLGINASEDVLGFVRAADKINVALSEDLGGNAEDSIREIGKLTDIFKLKDTYGMEESLLKVGSAINSLGAASTANEGYMVEFTKRLAGIAPNAKISIQDVLGMASTLDQLGQSSEVASTVMSQVLPDMFKNTALYADLAGMKVGDFEQLLETDANEAMIKFLEGLNNNNDGFGTMVNRLDALGLEGKRSISVVGVLANNTQLLRDQQQFANVEFEKGTSILDEFNVKNETARAGLDKAVKVIQHTWRELGEKLAPAIKGVVSGGTMLVRRLSSIVDFFIRFQAILKPVVAVLASYTAAVVAYSAASKVGIFFTKGWIAVKQQFTRTTIAATVAQEGLNKSMRANLFGAIIGVIMGVVTVIRTLRNSTIEAARFTKEFNQIQRDSVLAERQQIAELDRLFAALRKTTYESNERKKIIQQLHEQHGITITDYKETKKWEDELTKAYNLSTTALKNKIKEEVYGKQIAVLQAKELDLEEKLLETNKKRIATKQELATVSDLEVERSGALSTNESKYTRELVKTNQALIKNREEQEKIAKKSIELTKRSASLTTVVETENGEDDTYIPTNETEEEKKKRLEEEKKKRLEETKRKTEEIKRQAVAIKKSYESLYEEVAYIEETEYTRSLKLLEDKFEEQKKIIATAQTTMINGADGKMSPIISPEEATRTLELIEVQYFNKRLEIDQKEYERLISVNAQKSKTEEEYQVKIQELREQYVQRNSTLINYEITLLEEQHSKGLLSTEEYTRKLEELNIQKNNISLQFDKQVAQEQLKHLTALHSQKLVSTEEYTARSIELNKKIENIQSSILSESSALQLKQLTELNTLYSEKKKEVLMTDEEYQRRSLEITENAQNLTQQEVTQSLEELNQKREQSKEKALQIENEYHAEMRRILSQSGSDSSSNVLIQQLTELNTLYSEKKKEVLMTDEEYHRQSLEITTNSQNLTQQEVTKSLEELNQKREQSKVKSLQIENEYQAEMRRVLLQSSQEDITLEESLYRQLQSIRRTSSEEGMAVLMMQLTELHNTYIEQQEKTLMSEEEYSQRRNEIIVNTEALTKEQVTEELKKLEEEREIRANKALIIEQEYRHKKQEIINKAVQDDAELKAETERQEKLLVIRRQYGLLSNAELMQEELDQLEEHYKDLIEKDKAYYQAKDAIVKKYSTTYDEKNPTDTSKISDYGNNNSNTGLSIVSGFSATAEYQLQKDNLAKWFDTENEMLKQQYDAKLINEETFQKNKEALETAHAKFSEDLTAKGTIAQIDAYANMFGTLAGFFEQGSAEWKAFSVFQVVLSTASAAMNAYNTASMVPYIGYILGPIAAAAAIAFGAVQINEILSTEQPEFSVPQHSSGYYDVLGNKDGKRYQAKYKGKPETGYVSTPSLYLAGDDPNRLSEMIVSGPDLQNPMIADYARAIIDIKHNRQPIIMQSPVGYSTSSDTTMPKGQKVSAGSVNGLGTSPEVVALLSRISDQLEKPTRAKVVFSDLEEANRKVDTIRNDVKQ